MPDASFSHTLLDRLAHADHVTVLTGAGISAESGIPTFRDPDGLWEKFDPEELANVQAFLENPELVQGWYHHRRTLAQDTQPNPAHGALADLEDLASTFTLITQNVDGLHQRAGSRNVIELHGNLTRNYCIDCERPASDEELATATEDTPVRCSACGGYIRPDVVWFGEALSEDDVDGAHEAAMDADVFFSVGTSGVVHPAAGYPLTAKQHGAYVVEVNITATPVASFADEVLRGKAGEVLPPLVEAMRARRSTA